MTIHDPVSSNDRKGHAYCILTAKMMIFLLAGVSLSLSFRPKQELGSRPITEDGYYSLSVARNIANGRGITIDGTQPTNGFQPLFTFITVPAFWVAGEDRLEAIRYVLILHWLFFFTTAWIIGLIARDGIREVFPRQADHAFWWTVLLFVASSWIFLAAFNGLETGCQMFLYALAWRYYQRGRFDSWLGLFGFGALLGLLVLVRIDAVFLVVFVSVVLFLKLHGVRFAERALSFTIVGGMAFLVSLPWWAYNVMTFGSLMPISGEAQQEWLFSWERLAIAAGALLRVLVPYVYLGESQFEGPTAHLFRLGVLATATWLCWRARTHVMKEVKGKKERMNPLAGRTVEFGTVILLVMLVLLGWYVLSSYATYFYVRYFTPLAIVSTVFLAYALLEMIGDPKGIHALIPVALAIPVCLVTYAYHGGVGKISNEYYAEQFSLVQQHVPNEDLVAAYQTGTLGYFRDHVINLDGKVNPDIHRVGFEMSKYMRERNIRWICDWTWMVVPNLTGKDPEKNGWRPVARTERFVLYHYNSLAGP